MRNRTFADLDRVVALGGGHGLGRVMSSLSSLGSRLTGIVTTTDNGGSTGRIRRSEGGIAWGDMRNCINQLIAEPSVASAMFEYRFGGNGELSGHNLGNLMLKGAGSPERAAVRGDQFDQKPVESGRFPDPDVRTTGGFDGARS